MHHESLHYLSLVCGLLRVYLAAHNFAEVLWLLGSSLGLTSVRLFFEGFSEGSFCFGGGWDLVIIGIVMQVVMGVAAMLIFSVLRNCPSGSENVIELND